MKAHTHDHELLALEADNILGVAALAEHANPECFLDIVEGLVSGGYLDLKGHPLALLRVRDKAIDLSRSHLDGARSHRLLSKRGNVHYNQGEYHKAILVYREALTLAPSAERRAILLGVIGKALAECGEWVEAQDHFTRAYALCEANSDEHALMRVLEQHSVAAFRHCDYDQVAQLAARGIGIAQRLELPSIEATFRTNLGTARFKLGVHAAIEEHDNARRMAEELGDDHVLAMAHRTLGADYQALEDFETAHYHFGAALKLFVQLGQTDRHERLRQMMQQFGYPV